MKKNHQKMKWKVKNVINSMLNILLSSTAYAIFNKQCLIYIAEAPKKVLTHKEKKELKKKQKMEAEIERITKKGGEGHSALGDNFTVAQALKTGGALVQLETAVDIKIDKFSIAAKGKDLFRDASLTIAQGRR